MNDYDGDKMRIFSEKLLDIASASIPKKNDKTK